MATNGHSADREEINGYQKKSLVLNAFVMMCE